MTEALEAPDEEGAEFDALEGACLEAFHGAQELWPVLLEARQDPRRYTYRISNSAGEALLEIPFSDCWIIVRRLESRRRLSFLIENCF
jgi:hypothetical protein